MIRISIYASFYSLGGQSGDWWQDHAQMVADLAARCDNLLVYYIMHINEVFTNNKNYCI